MMHMEDVQRLARVCERNDGVLYITGGYTRDINFNAIHGTNLVNKDFDIEVFAIPEEQLVEILQKQFGSIKLCGKSFGVYKVENLDIGLPRYERKIGNRHNEFSVNIDHNMTVSQAANRRDFTMNAIYYNPLNEDILDPLGGIEDITNKELYACNFNSFMEDPLRILRAAQFIARFDLKPSWYMEWRMKHHIHELKHLPRERVFTEIEKLLMKAPRPSIGFELLKEIGALQVLIPSLVLLEGVTQNPKFHPEGNVWMHTMKAIDYFPPEKRDLITMLAILFHDVGKLVELKGHAPISAEMTETILRDALTNDSYIITNVYKLILYHTALLDKVTRNTIRRIAAKTDFLSLLKVYEMDRFSRGPDFIEPEKIQLYTDMYFDILNEVKPIIMGRHLMKLGVEVGPIYSEILKAVFERQLDGEFNEEIGGMRVLIDEVEKRNPRNT